ncbi:MAG: TatD family hydrolase [Coriobacteriia bacterium]
MVGSLPVLPDLGAPSVDAHAHLAMLDDPVAALVRASRAGIALVATVVDLTESPETTLDGLAGWLARAAEHLSAEGRQVPEVRIIAGWHPHNASGGNAALLERLRELAGDPRVGGLGELGLDYHYDHSPRDDQREWFGRHLRLAHEVGLPVEIHLREAHDEGLAILREVGTPEAGCIIHCFSEGPELAERFLELGCHISFAGPVTFKRSDALREAARIVPLDRLLVETDCPFLAPQPYRGRPNEPAFSVLNAATIAEVKGISPAEVATAALGNARELFGRGKAR